MAHLAVEHNWIKYGLAALIIHGVILALPLSEKGRQVATQRVIDIVVMKQETPPPPRLTERPLSRRPLVRDTAPRVRPQVPAAQAPRAVEKKEEPPSSGAGNVVDEQVVSQAILGPGGDEGVGIAGVNAGGSRVGAGSGGTGSGTGAGGKGSGAVTGSGPVDTRFGEADGPQIVYQESPEYPYAARRLQKSGKVTLALTMDEKGKLQKVDVAEASDQIFVAPAISAVKRWKFLPARRNGMPVACRAPCALRFGFD